MVNVSILVKLIVPFSKWMKYKTYNMPMNGLLNSALLVTQPWLLLLLSWTLDSERARWILENEIPYCWIQARPAATLCLISYQWSIWRLKNGSYQFECFLCARICQRNFNMQFKRLCTLAVVEHIHTFSLSLAADFLFPSCSVGPFLIN